MEIFSLDENGNATDMQYSTALLFHPHPKLFLVDDDFCMNKN